MPTMYFRQNILILFTLLATSFSYAQQNEFIFKNFTQEEGIPSNETYFVFQDSKHYIWIASDLGVVRYNGNKFEQFDLPDKVVFRIFEDKKGRIWFFSHKMQLAYFADEKIQAYKYNDRILQRIKSIHVKDAFVDDSDNIYLSSALDSNYILSANGKITANNDCQFNNTPSIFKISTFSNSTCFTQKELICAEGADTLIVQLHNENRQINYRVPFKHKNSRHFGTIPGINDDYYFFSDQLILHLKADGSFTMKQMPSAVLCMTVFQNNLWVGMIKNGAVLLEPDLAEKTNTKMLSNLSITQITPDYENGIWLSTLENAVFYIKNTNLKRLGLNEQSSKSVARLLNINDSMLVFSNTKGLYKMSGQIITTISEFENIGATDISFDKAHNLYFYGSSAQYFGKLKVTDNYFKQIFFYPSPSEIIFTPSDSLVFSTSQTVRKRKGIFYISRNFLNIDLPLYYSEKQLLGLPARIFKNANGTIWAGTNEGLYKADNHYDTLLKYIAGSQLLARGISCIREMDRGILVAGIRFGGVAFIKDSAIIANITEKEGLLSNKVRFLLPLKDQLWVATARGISVILFSSFQPMNYRIINIGKNDGFYNITINQLLQFQQKIIAATSNGIYFIEKPDAYLARKPLPIPFYIKSFSWFKGDSSGISNVTLPYSKNRILIRYNAVSFNSSEEIIYHYRFDNADTNWHTTMSTELLLENLAPGNYTLQIKASLPGQQRFSAIQSFSITVLKPWWQKNWIRLLAALLLLAVFYFYIAARINKIRREEKRKTTFNAKIAELEQTALRSQMNPHFIFNCLTSIQQLIVSGNKIDANEYLVKFARLIRKTLELSTQPLVSVREEIEYLEEYIFLEQFRLNNQFDYTISTDIYLNKDIIMIPNMMIQPIVENCIRHGIKSLENKKGLITVYFKQNGNYISCTITDNGVGRVSSSSFNRNAFTEHKSFGVDIIRKRLQAIAEFNHEDIAVNIEDLYNKDGSAAGTKVTIQLPFKK